MRIDIEYIKYLQEERGKINRMELSEIEFYENDKKLEINPELVKQFELTGLTNIDFIYSNFYINGFESYEFVSEKFGVATIHLMPENVSVNSAIDGMCKICGYSLIYLDDRSNIKECPKKHND